MELITFWNKAFGSTLGHWGSPVWYLVAACVVTVFFARWARAIRTLLPFLGAFTLMFLVVWSLVGLGVIKLNLPA